MPGNRLDQASRRKRRANAGSFVKGDPRINRAGRPKGFTEFVETLRDEGREEEALQVLERAMRAKKPGSVAFKAAELLLAYTRGRPVQVQHITTNARVQVEEAEDLSQLSTDELRAYRELRAKTARREPAPAP
jgi:hypothetical protein